MRARRGAARTEDEKKARPPYKIYIYIYIYIDIYIYIYIYIRSVYMCVYRVQSCRLSATSRSRIYDALITMQFSMDHGRRSPGALRATTSGRSLVGDHYCERVKRVG